MKPETVSMVTLLVACTRSKHMDSPPKLDAAKINHLPPSEAREGWRAVLNTERRTATMPASRLYKGGYWSAVRDAVIDHAVEGWIVSAGLGLAGFGERVPTYAATFTPGARDSVPGANSLEGRRAWWNAIGGAERLEQMLNELDGRPLLVALPSGYLEVAQPVLETLGPLESDGPVVVLGNTSSPALAQAFGEAWIPLDLRLAHHVGGTAGQLTARTAAYLLRYLHRPEDLTPAKAKALIAQLPVEHLQPLYPKRRRCTESDVRDWILEALESPEPPGSATAALRRFRNGGLAYEQKKFSRLFRSVVREQQEDA
jgi:hypothetical protein